MAPDLLSAAAQPAELSMYFDHDRFHLTYSAPADIGALVQQALIEAKDALFLATHGAATSADAPDGPSDSDTSCVPGRQVRMAEAMAQLATRSLQIGTETVAGRASKFRIYLHLDTTGKGWLTKAGALPPHLLHKWTCDGLVQPVWETGGSPVNVGRAHRIVPDRTRRLVQDRDRGRAYPGCLTLHHVECHHVVHWAHGGTTDMDNLISLCPHHHDRHHTGDFTIHPIAPDPTAPSTPRPTRPVPVPHPRRLALQPVTTTPPPARHDTPDTTTARAADPENARNGPAEDTHPHQVEPPRYIGPTNEVLHLDWVRFHRRPPAGATDGDSGDDPPD